MAQRSLQASPEGIRQIRKAMERKGWAQKELADEVGCTRQPIGNLLQGKGIDRNSFKEICFKLDLDWEKVAALPETDSSGINADANTTPAALETLVTVIREYVKPIIQERCGTMRVLDMTQPIGVSDIYTDVNILEKITGRQRKELAELLEECGMADFDRFGLSRVSEKRVPGLKAVEKCTRLMILGKPGAGKTTFLKHVGIQCSAGKFQAQRIPFFITLKDFAEAKGHPSLLDYLDQEFFEAQFTELFAGTTLPNWLRSGQGLILLDGLDEVRDVDSQRVLKEIRDFADRYHNSQFVITCRIAAREYIFEKFTEVEIADFDDEQIETFAENWFKLKAVKATDFLKRLQENQRLRELATNPLLLTLLCLTFEETGNFPKNRAELYKEGLDALLKKWDAKRGIYRDQVYKQLSVQRKEDLLSKVAFTTFESGDYFFKQGVAEKHIADYIRNLPDASTHPKALQVDSERVLRSIVSQHGLLVARAKGIYSYSHLTFHEYFTAREIIVVQQSAEMALEQLVSHLTEKRWREVLLLAVGMSPNADRLLLRTKLQIDALLQEDEKLQQVLTWVAKKCSTVDVTYKPVAVRAFYFALARARARALALDLDLDLDLARALDRDRALDRARARARDLARARARDLDLARALARARALDRDLARARDLALDLDLDLDLTLARARDLALALARDLALDPELQRSFQSLKDQLPDPEVDQSEFEQWWKVNGQTWTEELRAVMIQHRNIGHDWQFTEKQKELLQQYYDANLLLVECLNSDCYVSREVREQIEDTLLLPIAHPKNQELAARLKQ